MIEEEAKNTVQEAQLSGEGFAPIRMAALDGHVEMVKLLLQHKATPEVQDEWGFLSPEVFQVIREFGGKVSIQHIHLSLCGTLYLHIHLSLCGTLYLRIHLSLYALLFAYSPQLICSAICLLSQCSSISLNCEHSHFHYHLT